MSNKDLILDVNQAFLTFPILMTVKLGTGIKSADDFHQALKKAGQKLDNWANNLLNQPAFKIAGQPTEVSIVAPTVAELGFKDGGRYADICQCGLEFGHYYCPPELGPQMRLQYKNQPKSEALFFLAMEAIHDSAGTPSTFIVYRDVSNWWLCGNYAGPDRFISSGHRIVFVYRK